MNLRLFNFMELRSLSEAGKKYPAGHTNGFTATTLQAAFGYVNWYAVKDFMR
jgi:hypothetical protein